MLLDSLVCAKSKKLKSIQSLSVQNEMSTRRAWLGFLISVNKSHSNCLTICMDNWTQYPQWRHWSNTALKLNNGPALPIHILCCGLRNGANGLNVSFLSIDLCPDHGCTVQCTLCNGLLVHSVMSSSHHLLGMSVVCLQSTLPSIMWLLRSMGPEYWQFRFLRLTLATNSQSPSVGLHDTTVK